MHASQSVSPDIVSKWRMPQRAASVRASMSISGNVSKWSETNERGTASTASVSFRPGCRSV